MYPTYGSIKAIILYLGSITLNFSDNQFTNMNYSWFHENCSSVNSRLMNTIYLSLRTQVAEGTVFRKHTVVHFIFCESIVYLHRSLITQQFLFRKTIKSIYN